MRLIFLKGANMKFKFLLIVSFFVLPFLIVAQEDFKYKYVEGELLIGVPDGALNFPLDVYAGYVSYSKCNDSITIDSLVYMTFKPGTRTINSENILTPVALKSLKPDLSDNISMNFGKEIIEIFKKYGVFYIKRGVKAFAPSDTIPHYITSRRGKKVLTKSYNFNKSLVIKFDKKYDIKKIAAELKGIKDVSNAQPNAIAEEFTQPDDADKTASQTKIVDFVKVTNTYDFPPVFKKLDSLLTEFYIWSDYANPNATKWTEREMPEEMLMAFAKLLVWKNCISNEIGQKYLELANAVSKDQYRRENEANEKGTEFVEIKLPMPGGVLSIIRRDMISKKLSWEWQFHLVNNYLLIVEPITAESLPINPEDSNSQKADYYNCKVIDDIKGNYSGSNPILLGVNFVKGKMKTCNQYLVLIYGRNSFEKYYGEHYLVRGIATDDEAIFPIKDGMIINNNDVLKTGKRKMQISEYKELVRNFIHKTAEVPYEK